MKKHSTWKIFFASLAFACFVISCSDSTSTEETTESTVIQNAPDRDQLLRKISELEKKALTSAGTLDTSVANELLQSYQEFYTHYNKDSASAEMLFHGADVARGLGKYRKCIELLTNLHDGYPSFKKRDEVAFLIAFTWDANVKDTARAIRGYNQVVEFYPRSPWAVEAQNNIRLLQMTEKELLEFLKKQNS